jgi:putative ABC transport system permease protein
MLVTTLSALLFSIQATFGRIDAEQAAQVITADRVVSAGGGAPGLPSSVARDVGRLPGVASASGVASATVYLPQDATSDPSRVPSWTASSALGVDPGMLNQVLRLHVQDGSLAQLDDSSIAVSAEGAPVDGLHAGQRLQLRMPDGQPVSVRVAAVLTGAAGVAGVVMPRALLEAHTTQGLDQMVLVRAQRGADGRRLDADLSQLAASYPTLLVQRTADFLAGQNQSVSTQSRTATYLVLGLGLLFAGVSTVNTLMVATAERAREFALLRLVGMRRWQLLRMIGWETAALIAFGLLGSVFVVAVTMGATSWAYARHVFVEVPVDVYVIAGLAALLAVLSSLIPTQLALRTRPMDALGVGE